MITAVAVIAALRLGKELVIPLTLAILLSFLLAHPAGWLEKLKLGRVLSVVIVLLVTVSAAGGMIWIGAQQLSDIVSRLPSYQENIQRKLQKVRNPAGSEFARAIDSIRQIATELAPSNASANQANQADGVREKANGAPAVTPVPVQVVKEKPSVFDSFGMIGSSVASFFVMAAAVIILTLFILVRRGDLRNRLFRLFGQGRINVMTTAMDDVAARVSRYLLTQSLVNCTFGLLLGVGINIIGVPYAAFWGALGAVLRFIPYVGTLTAGLCPFLLSLAVFDGWKKPLLTLALFAVVELTMSSIVEPWLYATRTGISSLAVLFSAAFWTMLWGPIGLVVATPLTVLLFVLGRYVPHLEFLYILLGDEPVLPPHALYYQRLLAMDEDEARAVIDDYLKEHTALETYDSVLIPALSLAEQDRHANQLEEDRQRIISETTRELIEEIGENGAAQPEAAPFTVPGAEQLKTVCAAARDEADEFVGVMATQILEQAGFLVNTIRAGFVEEVLEKVTQAAPDVLIISALPPFAINHARALCRRTRQRSPGVKVMIGLWGSSADAQNVKQRLGSGCPDYVVHSLQEMRLQLRLFVEQVQSGGTETAEQAAEHAAEAGEAEVGTTLA